LPLKNQAASKKIFTGRLVCRLFIRYSGVYLAVFFIFFECAFFEGFSACALAAGAVAAGAAVSAAIELKLSEVAKAAVINANKNLFISFSSSGWL